VQRDVAALLEHGLNPPAPQPAAEGTAAPQAEATTETAEGTPTPTPVEAVEGKAD
jgi:hypothetical protein